MIINRQSSWRFLFIIKFRIECVRFPREQPHPIIFGSSCSLRSSHQTVNFDKYEFEAIYHLLFLK